MTVHVGMRFRNLRAAFPVSLEEILKIPEYEPGKGDTMKSEITLGIDFGTSNSLVGAWKEGKRLEALPLDPAASDPTLMRTLLYFPHVDRCFYGSEAIQNYIDNEMEGRFFRSFKSHLPNRSYLGTVLENRILTLESLVGIFLLEIRKRAEKILDSEITSAVIGRPARYSMDPIEDEFALHRMRKAAEFAGFKKFDFVPEPLAAAFDYRRKLDREKLVLIGDFGGGTSDFTLIRMGPYAFQKEHVLGLDGCSFAGDSLDSLFMSQKLSEHFGSKAQYRVSLGRNNLTMPPPIITRLHQPAHIVHLKERDTYEFIRQVQRGALTEKDRAAVERLLILVDDQQIFPFFEGIEGVKRQLSDFEKAEFKFDYPGLEISTQFEKGLFEKWAEPIHKKIFDSLDRCLQQAQVSSEAVDMVCLTGGSAQVPLIKAEFEKRFGIQKLQAQSHFHSVLSGLIESAGFFSEGRLAL